jgi:hypothetical protein
MAVSAPYYPNAAPVYMGLAADTKPTNVPIGSKYFAYDAQTMFVFTNAGTWVQVGSAAASPVVEM